MFKSVIADPLVVIIWSNCFVNKQKFCNMAVSLVYKQNKSVVFQLTIHDMFKPGTLPLYITYSKFPKNLNLNSVIIFANFMRMQT